MKKGKTGRKPRHPDTCLKSLTSITFHLSLPSSLLLRIAGHNTKTTSLNENFPLKLHTKRILPPPTPESQWIICENLRFFENYADFSGRTSISGQKCLSYSTTATVLDGILSPPTLTAFTRYSSCGPRGWFVSEVSLSIAIPTCDHEPNSPPPAGCSRRLMI